jgi:hypothetical protein
MLPPPSVVDGWIAARRRSRQTRGGHLRFLGAHDSGGYGVIFTRSGLRRVHELAVEVAEGRVLKPGEQACHRCEHKDCHAPSHVYRGNAQTNADDLKRATAQRMTDPMRPEVSVRVPQASDHAERERLVHLWQWLTLRIASGCPVEKCLVVLDGRAYVYTNTAALKAIEKRLIVLGVQIR